MIATVRQGASREASSRRGRLCCSEDICQLTPLNGPDSGHIIAQFFCSLQCSFDPDNLDLSGGNLSGRFAATSRGQQAARGWPACVEKRGPHFSLAARAHGVRENTPSEQSAASSASVLFDQRTDSSFRSSSFIWLYGGGYRNRASVESAVHSKLPAGGCEPTSM